MRSVILSRNDGEESPQQVRRGSLASLGMTLLAAIAILTACSNDTPDQKLAKDIAPAVSWVSTVRFTAEDWLGNRVPSAFVRETAKAAEKAFEKAQQTAEQSQSSAVMRSAVEQQLRSANDAANQLEAAVKRGDRDAVARIRDRCGKTYDALHMIEDSHKR